MTIHLDWWAIPLAAFIIGMAWTALHDDGGGFFSGMTNILIGFCTIIATVALIIGHFI